MHLESLRNYGLVSHLTTATRCINHQAIQAVSQPIRHLADIQTATFPPFIPSRGSNMGGSNSYSLRHSHARYIYIFQHAVDTFLYNIKSVCAVKKFILCTVVINFRQIKDKTKHKKVKTWQIYDNIQLSSRLYSKIRRCKYEHNKNLTRTDNVDFLSTSQCMCSLICIPQKKKTLAYIIQ